MKTEISQQFRHSDTTREELKPKVMAAEKEAAKELGGPVKRMHKFINGGTDVIFTWRRV